MKHILSLVCFIVLSTFVCLSCSNNNKDVKSAADQPAGCTSPWAKGTPNPLLRCVPADAAFILATQRGQTMENYGMRTIRYAFSEFFSLGRVSDFETRAPLFGLNGLGKLDAVFYLRDNSAMLYITVEDEEQALKMLDSELKATFDWCETGTCDEYDDDSFTITDEKGWHIYSFEHITNYHWRTGRYQVEPYRFGVRVKDGVAILAIWYGDQIPSSDLVVAKKPYEPSVVKDDVFVGHIDYSQFGEFIFRFPYFAQNIDYDYLDDYPTQEDEEKMEALRDESTPAHNVLCHGRDYDFSSVSKVIEDIDDDVVPCMDITKVVGTTSIADNVCISEFKSLFEDLNSADFALNASESGKVGLRISSPVLSSALKNLIESSLTSYGKLEDDYPNKTSGYVAVNATDVIHWLQNKWHVLNNRDWKCNQLKGTFRDWTRYDDDDDMFKGLLDYFDGFQSISFLLRDTPSREEQRKGADDTPVYVGHIRHSTEKIRFLADELFYIETPLEQGKVITEEGYRVNKNILLKDNEAFLGTAPYDLTKMNPVLTKENFLGVHISKGLMDSFMGRAPGFLKMSLVTDFQIDLAYRNGQIEFTIVPQE